MEKIIENKFIGVTMQVSKTNNIIFLKNAESNIIDQAFVILKDNIKVNELSNKEKSCSNSIKETNILKEAELLINQKIKQNNLEYDKFRINKLEKKIKILKTLNIITIIASIIAIIIK